MKRLIILLIVAALSIVMAGCDSSGDGDDGSGNQSYILPIAYTLTIGSTAGGAVAVNNAAMTGKATFIFGAGTVVSLNAAPDSGYQFVRWTGNVDTIDNVHASEIIVTMNGNYSIMANFEVPPPIRYSLAILCTPGGSVTTPGRGTHIYDAGMVVSLVATPARGYRFYKWSGDVGTIADVNTTSTSLTMYGDYYICANFREEESTCG